MASKKKASEGIALLSMYNDEDDDMDDAYDEDDRHSHHDQEHAEEDDQQQHSVPILGRDDDSYANDPSSALDSSRDNTPLPPHNHDDSVSVSIRTLTPPQQSQSQFQPLQSPPMEDLQKNRRGKLTIVDYGHDEAAMSPEPEEGEVESTSEPMFDGELHIANGNFQGKSPPGTVQVLTQGVQATSLSSEQVDLSHSDTIAANNSVIEIEVVEMEETAKVSIEAGKDVDLLDKFISPPPKAKCSDELQEKIKKFLKYKKEGKSFNAEVRNRKDYRNPDFLVHAVRYQDIDQIGTCFRKDVFDPHGYDKSDYYDEIEADMKREMEKREQEKKRSQKVDFVAGGTQPGNASAANKINLPIPGMSTVASSGSIPVSNAVDAASRDSRQNKKSKWDKVDGDRRNPLPPSGGQDSTSSVGAHAALLSAANAGAGYTAFAQQRRREAEEKRSSERKLERRS